MRSAICATFILTAAALLAQQPAVIQGLLTDPSGAAVPSATVSISGTNAQLSVQTAADGAFTFNGVVGGNYTLRVDSPGLEPFEQRITAEPGRIVRLPIQLRLRVSTQAVTVTGDRGPELSLDPGESAGATVVKGSDLDALPDNPDDLNDMLQALAGPGRTQIIVDGFEGGQIPPKSAIREIRINQDRFAADRASWWNSIEIFTKPGAEKFHGGVGLTDSDAVFNSRNPYSDNKAGYVNRMVTANVGGSFNTRASWNLNFYQNTIDNTALINAVTLDPATLLETAIHKSVVIPRDDISGTGRFDFQLSTKHALTASYRSLESHRDGTGIGQYNLESRGYSSGNTASEVRLSETATLSNSMVTDTRFGYTRNGTSQNGESSIPSLIVSASFNGGSSQTGQTSRINTMVELGSNTIVSHKTHTLRFGGRLRYNPITDVASANFGGTFSFFGVSGAPVLDADNQPLGNATAQITSLEQYRRTLLFQSLHYPAALIRSLGGGASQFSIAAGDPRVHFSQTDADFYTGDDWRLRPNLTLSLGLRYELQTNIHDWKNFGPRIGLAWSPHAKNGSPPKTVIRAGWGLFYFRVDPLLTQQTLRFNGTREHQYVVQNPDFYPDIPAITSLAGGQSSTTYRFDPRLRALPELLYAITLERQLPGKSSLSIMYLDQRNNHMPQTVNINAPLPGTFVPGQAGVPGQGGGVRPYGDAAGNIFQYESGGIQKVKWLEIHVNTKLNQWLSLNTQYLLISAHNNGGWDNATPSNPYNFNADWGAASWALKHNLDIIGTVNAPGGLQFSPFITAASGQPYDLTLGSDRNGDTVANDRPAFATDLTRPSVVVTRFGALDTNPQPGQTLVPRNYLRGAPMWLINMRVSRTFGFGKPKETPRAGYKGPAQHRYGVNLNIETNNILNHLNPGGYVGVLASPLFGQATALGGFRDNSNNRKVQLGAQFTF